MVRRILMSICVLSVLLIGTTTAAAEHDDTQPATTPWGLLVQAGKLKATNSPACASYQFPDYPPYPKKWWELARDSEQHNQQLFKLLRQSRLLMQTNGGHSGIPQGFSVPLFQQFNPMRNIANIVSDGAVFANLTEHDANAVARLLDAMNLADCIRQNQMLVSQLVAMGIAAKALDSTDSLAPGLDLNSTTTTTQRDSTRTARREVHQLIDELLNEQPVREMMRQSIKFELASILKHAATRPAKPAATQPVVPWPLMTMDQIQRNAVLIEQAVRQTNWPKAQILLDQCVWPDEFLKEHKLTLPMIIKLHFRRLAESRMSAISLAAQLYRADHNNRWPRESKELVPKYLKSIPRDPYRSDGEAIGYRLIRHGWPNGTNRPMVFVDSGKDMGPPTQPQYSSYRPDRTDIRQYRDLSWPVSKTKARVPGD